MQPLEFKEVDRLMTAEELRTLFKIEMMIQKVTF